MSQATQENRSLSIITPLGKDQLLLTAFSGREEMSRLFCYELDMLSANHAIKAADVVGMNVTFSVRRKDGNVRYFNGFVNRFMAGGLTRTKTYRKYRAEVVPWTWFMTRTTDCRIFQFKTVPQIIEQVFGDLGFTDFNASGLRGQYPERDYCVQYRNRFDFVSRLMEEEGIFYFFHHENGKHTLMLADAQTAYDTCPESNVKFRHTTSEHSHEDRVTAWEHRYEFRPGKWSHTDYNFEMPSTSLAANEDTVVNLSKNKAFEIYDYPGVYGEVDEGRRLARVRMEAEEACHDVVQGESTCATFTPGGKFTFLDCDAESESGQTVLITSIRHEARESAPYDTVSTNGEEEEEGEDYGNEFTCIPDSVLFRPARITPKARVEGTQTAVVVGPPGEEIYPDQYGRVKVQFHWDREGRRDENSSCWIRVSQIHAGKGWGAMDLPRIGEEVIVDFLEGDPDRPIITGRVYNGENMPPFDLPAGKTRRGNKTKTYKGAGYNEMSMDDTPGKEQIRIHAQHDLDAVVGNNETHVVGVDRTTQIGNNDTLSVGVNRIEQIGTNKVVKAGSNVLIEAGTAITLKCGASLLHMNQAGVIMLKGTMVTVAGMINTNITAPLTTVSGVAVLEGGAVMVSAGAVVNKVLGGTTTVDGGEVKINC